MARLKLALFGTPRDRSALSQLRDHVRTTLDETEAQAQLEGAGVWIIARQHAPVDKDGNVRWSRGLIP